MICSRLPCVVLIALVLAGCSQGFDYGPTGTVTGRLTLNGNPLKPNTQVVLMNPEKGYAAFGGTDDAGSFTITSWNDGHLPLGKYEAMIQPAVDPNWKEPTADELMDNPRASVVPSADFPAKYRDTKTSGLAFEVKEGENKFEIDLKK